LNASELTVLIEHKKSALRILTLNSH